MILALGGLTDITHAIASSSEETAKLDLAHPFLGEPHDLQYKPFGED